MDGQAFDIYYGGFDHILALDENMHVIVIDIKFNANTGGQSSKAIIRDVVLPNSLLMLFQSK